uniref:START domain-containing protein n=1 Tax=Macrostomum lignano TaxID=282301 RepID=A0A1I8J411_9PLAT
RLLDCLYRHDADGSGYAVSTLGGVGDDFSGSVGEMSAWPTAGPSGWPALSVRAGPIAKPQSTSCWTLKRRFAASPIAFAGFDVAPMLACSCWPRLDLAAGHLATKLPAIGLPPIASCTLSRPWQRISYDAYCELSCTARLRELALPSDLFFSAAIRCSQQRIAFLALCVPVDYPIVCRSAAADNPSSAMLTCSSDLELHEVESEINVHPLEFLPDEADRQNVLPVQLHRLALALEMYFKRHQSGGANPPNRSGRPYRP